MKRALIAMSGGVDSSVAAHLMLEQGYECVGCTMRLFENDMIGEDLFSACCSAKDTSDARAVAESLGMPFHVFHYENDFREKVIEPFVKSYENGETPNPCIDCNRHLKFGILYEKMEELGCDVIVTGHYAGIERGENGAVLKKAKDKAKDQSYVLYDLTRKKLERTAFPLGSLTKEEVRKIALEKGFVNAAKKESQDICFVPDGDYASMILRYRDREYPEGPITDTDGNRIGTHKGIVRYTVGQRRGLNVPSDKRLYVREVRPDDNTVVLSTNEELFSDTASVRNVNWISGIAPDTDIRCGVKIRYRHAEQPATVRAGEGNTAFVTFDLPQRAITPGQSAVFYDGDTVLGGGIISRG